jgi:REP element-mobilizing transposase RayT
MEQDHRWQLMAATIMPDHLHILVRLTGNLPVSRCIARLKTRSQRCSKGVLRWQANFYEHRMRPSDAVEDVVRYIFLNPHRAGIQFPDRYPWFWLGSEESAWFQPTTDEGLPFPEWLR